MPDSNVYPAILMLIIILLPAHTTLMWGKADTLIKGSSGEITRKE